MTPGEKKGERERFKRSSARIRTCIGCTPTFYNGKLFPTTAPKSPARSCNWHQLEFVVFDEF